MSTQINSSVVTGTSDLVAGQTLQEIVVPTAFPVVPQLITVVVLNTSADTTKLAISATVVGKSINGFTVVLTGAPNTANYKLGWSAYLETGSSPIAPFRTGSAILTQGQLVQTIAVSPVFSVLPEYFTVTVANTSNDADKYSIFATVINVSVSSFVVVLSGAPNSANYTIAWQAYAQSAEVVSGTITLIKSTLQPGFFPGACPQHVWPLKVQAISTIPGLANAIFVYHAAMDDDPYQGDTFSCVARVQQMTELPANAATTLEGRVIPFYRKDTLLFQCSSAAEAESLWQSVQDNVQALSENWKASGLVVPLETVIIN
jgi:hypothetical protein